jgi:hypothetical protein
VDAVRDYFRGIVAGRKGALISCDPIPGGSGPLARIVSKYHSGRAQAMTYVASLAVPFDNRLLELLVTASEDTVTGVREALITHELMLAAGESEKEQLKRNVFPIEWKFERYHPGTRGEIAYLLSDDEKHDAAFPHHPLTRVRRWLRHIERTFRVAPVEEPRVGLNVESDAAMQVNRCEIEPVPHTPMTFDEIVRELGPQIAADAVSEEAMKKVSRERNEPIMFPPIENRQQAFRNQRDTLAREAIEHFQAQQKKLQSVMGAAAKFLQEARAEQVTVVLARALDTGRWLSVREGSARALAIFQNAAFFDDFTETTGLSCEPKRITIKELFAHLGDLSAHCIDSLIFDRCPRHQDVSQVIRLADIAGEADLLRLYATNVAGKRVLIEEHLHAAMLETDPAKRLSALKHIVEHMDPAHTATCLEIARLAAAARDAALFEYCRAKLSRYEPEHLASLAAFPG